MMEASESDTDLLFERPDCDSGQVTCPRLGCGCFKMAVSGRHEHSVEPRDRLHLVYVCMIVAGTGFLFPWFSLISAIDYFLYLYHDEFPHVSVTVPIAYLLSTLLSSTLNVAAVNRLPIHGRIACGYVVFILSLLFLPLLDIGINNCTVSTHVSYYLTLLVVVAIGLGSGVQQSSYYGLGSMLPRRYSQALMAGESVAGMVVAINRIVTKASFSSERTGAIAFFTVSLVFILVCVCCQMYIRASPMVRWHVSRCQREVPVRQNGGDIALEALSESESSDRDQLINSDKQQELTLRDKCIVGLKLRLAVARQIWRLVVAIAANYFVTLLLFPGLLSEVQYGPLGDWMPILVITTFNFFDLIAKWLALIPFHCSPNALVLGSVLRVVFIPLVLLCVSPSLSQPVLHHGVAIWACLAAGGLGITNGYYGSVPLINVSQEVKDDRDRELAATMMVWFLLGGLSLGSVLAYALTPLTELASDISNTTELLTFHACDNSSGT